MYRKEASFWWHCTIFLCKMLEIAQKFPRDQIRTTKKSHDSRCHTPLQGKVQTNVAGRLLCCQWQNILINYKGTVCLAAPGTAEPDQLIMLAGRIYRSQPDCWCYEITTAWKTNPPPPTHTHPFFPLLIIEAPLLSGAIREMKHLVPYACRLFGNSDAAISWHGVAYTLPVNYHRDIKTGSELHKGWRKAWGKIRESLLLKLSDRQYVKIYPYEYQY